MRFQVLGPIAVSDGESQFDIGGPQQRLVLALLVMHNNEAVSTERIIDILWQDEPPSTARKTIQGYVSALRRTLGDGAITTTATGYRLETQSDSVDALDFADRVGEARQMADAISRRFAMRDALELWHGAAYDDVGYVDAFRPEIARLDELKLVAIGEQLAADIETGPASAAIPSLEALVREHPLQERFRALLMVALYRSGRQTDALRVFEDARRYLATEVGLDPGPELRTLEQRILDQDPSLDGGQPLIELKQRRSDLANPYRGLRPFDEESGSSFYGREAVVRRLRDELDRVGVPRLVIVTGASGSGKSSVVRAGLVPALRDEGWTTQTVVAGAHSVEDIEAAIGAAPRLVVVDQFEHGLGDASTADELLGVVASAAITHDGPWIVITVRADYLDPLLAHATIGPWVERAMVLVPPMAHHEVAAAVERPAAAAGLATTPGVAEVMFAEMAGRGAGLPLMQYALTEMFDRRTSDAMTLDDYHRVNGLGGALANRAEEVYVGLSSESQAGLRQALLRLVELREDGNPALHKLPRNAFSDDQLAVLERFGEHRMVTFDSGAAATAEISHESLLREWPRLTVWIAEARDELIAQRRLRHAAKEWDESGREEPFLFGAALAGRYSGAAAPPSDSLEAFFLETSRARNLATERRRTRTRRIVTAGFAAGAVVSLALAVLANTGRQDAEAARSDAEARALASASVLQSQTDTELGLLLAVEAYRADPSVSSLSPLLNALGQVTGRSELFLASIVPTGDVVIELATLTEGARNATRVPCAFELGPGKFVAGNSGTAESFLITDLVTSDVVVRRGAGCQVLFSDTEGFTLETTASGQAQITEWVLNNAPVAVDPNVARLAWIGERVLGFAPGVDPIPLDLGDDSPKVDLYWVDRLTGAATPIDRTAVTVSAARDGSLVLLTDRPGPVPGEIPMGDAPVHRYIASGDDLVTIHDLGEMDASNAAAGWSDDASLVGDVSRSGNVRVWDTSSGAQIVDVQLTGVNPDEAIWIDFAPSGMTFAIVRDGGLITLHQVGPEARQIVQLQTTDGSAAVSSFIDDETLAVMRESGGIEIFDMGSLPFADDVVDCCGGDLLSFFTEDGGSGAVRLADGTLRIVDLPGGATQATEPGIVRVWRRPDGFAIGHTEAFELVDLAEPSRREYPFGPLQSFDSSITASTESGVLDVWVVTFESDGVTPQVTFGRIDMTTLQAVDRPHSPQLPANSRYLQTAGDRVLIGDVMGTVHQFGFDGESIPPRIGLPFVPTNASTLPGGSTALFTGQSGIALVDLATGEILSRATIDSPAPAALLPNGLAVIGRQSEGLDLWSTEPLLRLGRIANADSTGVVQTVSVDDSGGVWYFSGERYQHIPIDPETWVASACELAGGTLTADQWSQFVSANRPYDPACD